MRVLNLAEKVLFTVVKHSITFDYNTRGVLASRYESSLPVSFCLPPTLKSLSELNSFARTAASRNCMYLLDTDRSKNTLLRLLDI